MKFSAKNQKFQFKINILDENIYIFGKNKIVKKLESSDHKSFEAEVAVQKLVVPGAVAHSTTSRSQSPCFMGLGLAATKFRGSHRSILSRRREIEPPASPLSRDAPRRKSVNIIAPRDAGDARRKSFGTAGPQQLGFLGLTHFDGALDTMKKNLSDERSSDDADIFQALMEQGSHFLTIFYVQGIRYHRKLLSKIG